MTMQPSTWALLLDVALFLAELLITARRHSCAGFSRSSDSFLLIFFKYRGFHLSEPLVLNYSLLFDSLLTTLSIGAHFASSLPVASHITPYKSKLLPLLVPVGQQANSGDELCTRLTPSITSLLIAIPLLFSGRCSGARHRVTSSQRVLSTTKFSTASALSAFP